MPSGVYKRKLRVRETKNCIICNKEFSKPNISFKDWNKRKYCSKKCYNKDQIGREHTEEQKIKIGNSNRGKKKPKRSKIHCERIRISKLGNHNTLGKHWKVKDKSNLGKNKGEKHWNWIKDRTKLCKKQERNDSAYREWRKFVLKRDEYKCKICNLNYTKEHKLIVHHILPWKDFPELRYEINNGITLCQFHHPRKREDEKILIPFLQGMVEVK